jgi:hypothetical protein
MDNILKAQKTFINEALDYNNYFHREQKYHLYSMCISNDTLKEEFIENF